MKVTVVGTNQVMEVEGTLAVGDILIFMSTMAAVEVDEVSEEAKVVLVATTVNGIKTSALFGKLQAEYITEEQVEEEDGE